MLTLFINLPFLRLTNKSKMDDKEFEHMAKTMRERAIAAARACGLDADGAQDVAQDVLLKLWSLRGELHADARILSLVYRAAHNLAIDRQRRRRTLPLPDRPVVDEHYASPDQMLEIADNERWLQKKLQSLPSTEYQVLHLRQVERHTDEEIAAIIGIAIGSVPTLLSRARRKLLEAMRRRDGL